MDNKFAMGVMIFIVYVIVYARVGELNYAVPTGCTNSKASTTQV